MARKKNVTIEMSKGADIVVTPRQQELLAEAYTIFPSQLGVDSKDSRSFWSLVKKDLLVCTVGPKDVCDISGESDTAPLEEQGVKAVGMPTPLGAEVAIMMLKAEGKRPPRKEAKIRKEFEKITGRKQRAGAIRGTEVRILSGKDVGDSKADIVVDATTPSGKFRAFARMKDGTYRVYSGDGESKVTLKKNLPKYAQKAINERLQERAKRRAKRTRRKTKKQGRFAKTPAYGKGATRAERRTALRQAFGQVGRVRKGVPRLTDTEKAALSFVAIIDGMAESPRRAVDPKSMDGRRRRVLETLMATDLIFFDNVNRETKAGFSRPIRDLYTYRLTPQGKLYIKDFLKVKGKPTKAKVVKAVKKAAGAGAAKEVEAYVEDAEPPKKSKKSKKRSSRKSNPGEITVMTSDAQMKRAVGKSAMKRNVKVGKVTIAHMRGGLYRLKGPRREALALKAMIETA